VFAVDGQGTGEISGIRFKASGLGVGTALKVDPDGPTTLRSKGVSSVAIGRGEVSGTGNGGGAGAVVCGVLNIGSAAGKDKWVCRGETQGTYGEEREFPRRALLCLVRKTSHS
jgi:hypothetical protein